MMSDEKPTAQEMLPDPPTISLAPSVPISISQVHASHPSTTMSPEQPVSIAPFSQAAEQLNQQQQLSDQHYQLNHEYLRKKYRRKYENPDKIKELFTEQQGVITNLQTAIEGKMDVAAIGVLGSIISSLDFASFVEPSSLKSVECGDRQRALFKAGICPMIATCLRELGGQVMVCEKALSCVAFLCRFSEENRQSVCLENCKGMGLAGVCELVVGAIKRHGEDKRIIEASCDAVRSMCALESNRERLGNAGCCEALARSLTKYHAVADLCGWLCRAIGHLANNNDHNRVALGSAGAVQNVIITIQKFPASSAVCTEACWAVRQICPIEENRKRFFDDFGPESIMAVFKNHFPLEHFAVEASRCVVNMVSSEDDPIIPRLANSGFIGYALKALKRNPDSEVLARWVFNALYYIACEEKSLQKLVGYDILDQLSASLENHAGFEPLAEWGARITHKLFSAANISSRMRSAGLCEMIPSTVQRQAISAMISSVGCQAIGDLATDFANQERLSAAGACEAVVGALKRHNESADVVYNTCYAIHFLSLTQNNVSWMGAYGACEAVTNALNKHCSSSVEVSINSVSALASLAHKDEGNQLRIHAAGGCEAIVTALKTHDKSPDVTENACRAIYNMCGENLNVKDLGVKGACQLVVSSIQTHFDEPTVVTQSLLAIFALAVKVKGDRVHQGNTKKLVNKGAIEVVVAAMQKYAADEEVQRAAAMAVTSLARLENNRNKLGAAGACDLVMKAMKTHIACAAVVTKMALAIDGLSAYSEGNKVKFIAAGAVDILLAAFQKHEKVAYLVADIFRALVTLCTVEESRAKIHCESAFKMYVKALRAHDKNVYVARWGANMIYTAAVDDHNRLKLGNAKACEAVINVLNKHAAKSSEVSEWGCRAVVGLAQLEANKTRFVTNETCASITTALQEHYKEPIVAEWATAALASVAHTNLNRLKLGAAAVALCNTFNENMGSLVISKLVCEAIYELCIESTNQDLFFKANVCDTLISALTNHAQDAVLTMSICRAMANVSASHMDNSSKIGDLGGCELLINCMVTHMYNAPLVQWSCAAITALSSKNSKNQNSFGSFGAVDTIAKGLVTHKTTDTVCAQTTRALRALTNNHTENQKAVATSTVITPTLMQILKNHVMNQTIVEHTCWLLGNIEYKSARPGSVRVISTSERATPSPTVHITGGGADTEGSSTDATVHTIKPKEFYSKPANWDLLFLALQSHANHPNTGKWVCCAVSMFADHGKLPHGNMCDVLLTYLDKHIESDATVQRILQAIGALARTNVENNNRLSRGHACEIIDQIMSGYSEGNATIFGLLPAITGLADKNPANQNRFNAAPTLVKNVASVLYNELETDFISQWGCAAVAALARNNPGNQQKLSSVCSYIADVINTHKGNQLIALETFRAISALSHTSITNRNRLGASDACQAVPEVLKENINALISQPFHNIERNLLYWSARTIADLAANNPNNQAKLGANGACACLVRMLQKDSLPGELQQEVKFFTTVFWAIGNIVQLGKGPSMAIDDSAQALDGAESSDKLSSLGIAGMSGIAGTDKVLGGLNLIPGSARKAKKNTNRLMEAGVSDWTNVILLRYLDHGSVVQWGCRAINNLSKSSKLRANLIETGINEVIQKVFERHAGNSEVIEWAILARETLNGSTNVPI